LNWHVISQPGQHLIPFPVKLLPLFFSEGRACRKNLLEGISKPAIPAQPIIEVRPGGKSS